MKTRLTQTQIVLKDLPSDGREFSYSRASGELNSDIEDLVGKNDYQISFTITPVGNAYTLKGRVKTAMDLQCALCAGDFKFKIDQPLNELLVRQPPMGKGDFQTKANHAHEWTEAGPDYIMLESDAFQVGEYIHEAIALCEPIQPKGAPECDPECGKKGPLVEREWLLYGDKPTVDPVKSNPFQVLEKIKLKS